MTTRNRPDYGVFPILLTTKGSIDLPIIGTRVSMVAAVLNGANASALVGVQIGRALGDPIPFTTGTEVLVSNKFDFLRISWAAQSGITATIVISDDADGNGVHVTAAPTVAEGSVSIVGGGNTAEINAQGQLSVVVTAGEQFANIDSNNCLFVRQVNSQGPLSNPALNSLPQSSAADVPQVQPGSIGGSFYSNAEPSAGATEIIAPATNVNGVVVRTAFMLAGGSSYAVLAAGTAAPTTTATNAVILMAYASDLSIMPREIFLPAGQGLWFYDASASDGCWVTYDVL